MSLSNETPVTPNGKAEKIVKKEERQQRPEFVTQEHINFYHRNPVLALCEELQLLEGRWCVPHGDSSSGKTTAILQAMVDISLGRPIFGRFELHPNFFNGKTPALTFISFEMNSRPIWYKLERMYSFYGEQFIVNGKPRINIAGNEFEWTSSLKFIKRNSAKDQVTQDQALLEAWKANLDGIHFCGVDSFSAANSNWNENDREIGSQLIVLSKASELTGAVGTMIHHDTKSGESFRGSTGIRANIGSQYQTTREEGSNIARWKRKKNHVYYDGSSEFTFSTFLHRDISFPDGHGPLNIRIATEDEVNSGREKVDLSGRIINYLMTLPAGEYANLTKIRDNCKGNNGDLAETLFKMSTDGGNESVLEYEEGKKKAKLYRLRKPIKDSI